MTDSFYNKFFLQGFVTLTDAIPQGTHIDRAGLDGWRLSNHLSKHSKQGKIVATTAFFNLNTQSLQPCVIKNSNVTWLEAMAREGIIEQPEYWLVDLDTWMKM